MTLFRFRADKAGEFISGVLVYPLRALLGGMDELKPTLKLLRNVLVRFLLLLLLLMLPLALLRVERTPL